LVENAYLADVGLLEVPVGGDPIGISSRPFVRKTRTHQENDEIENVNFFTTTSYM